MAYFLQIHSTNKITKIRWIKFIEKFFEFSHIFVEVAHDVI